MVRSSPATRGLWGQRFGKDSAGSGEPGNAGSFYAVLRRGLYGVYHRPSSKYMPRYVDEFRFRLNDGHVGQHTLEQLDRFVDAVVGKRITYKDLTTAR